MTALLLALLIAPACPTATVDGPKMYTVGQDAIAAGSQGEHLSVYGYEIATRAFRGAAEAGDLSAQYALAKLIISTRYQAGPIKPAQKVEYVDALKWLIVAVKRGHPKARDLLPSALTAKLLKEPRKATPYEVFTDLPDAWLEEAYNHGIPLSRCWPAVKPTR